MSTIATTEFKVSNANSFVYRVLNSVDILYAFIGKSDSWSPTLGVDDDSVIPVVTDSLSDYNDALMNAIAMKKVATEDVVNMIPRRNWEYGKTYSHWDDADDGIWDESITPFYVITDALDIYKCLYAPLDSDGAAIASTSKPTHIPVIATDGTFESDTATGTDDIVTYPDGYVWKYMYHVTDSDAKFLSDNYIPVRTYESASGLTNEEYYNWQVQDASTEFELQGGIFAIEIISPGSGYSSTPTVTISGNGVLATAEATVGDDDTIKRIVVTNPGYNYGVVDVEITGGGGSGATARAILSPNGGHGTDPVHELGGFYVGVSAILQNNAASGDFNIDTEFRQIGLIENPKTSGTVATAETLNAMATVQVTMTTAELFNQGDYVTIDGVSVWYIDALELIAEGGTGVGDTYRLYLHQNDKTGYDSFEGGGVPAVGTNGAQGTISAGATASEYDRFSGRVLFLENRTAIERNPAQTEDLRFVVEF